MPPTITEPLSAPAGPTARSSAPEAPHRMQCMEVWGGSSATANGVSMPGLDVWVLAQPHDNASAGGDVHYVSSCGTGRISRLLLADVAGHGTVAASLAGALRNAMRRFVNYVDQSSLIALINQEFTDAAEADGAGRFATAVVATFWAPSSHLVLCNAGHPPPLAFSARRSRWLPISGPDTHEQTDPEPGGLPFGIDPQAKYDQRAIRLHPGDLVVLYSDALLECRRDDGSFIGQSGLLAILDQLSPAEPAALASALLAAVVDQCGGRPPGDDVTIMVLRPTGAGVQHPFLTRLAAGLRFLANMVAPQMGSGPTPWPEPSLANILGAAVPAVGRRLGRRSPEL